MQTATSCCLPFCFQSLPVGENVPLASVLPTSDKDQGFPNETGTANKINLGMLSLSEVCSLLFPRVAHLFVARNLFLVFCSRNPVLYYRYDAAILRLPRIPILCFLHQDRFFLPIFSSSLLDLAAGSLCVRFSSGTTSPHLFSCSVGLQGSGPTFEGPFSFLSLLCTPVINFVLLLFVPVNRRPLC